MPARTVSSWDGGATRIPVYRSKEPDTRAEYQAFLNADAELHRMYARKARQQEAAIRADAADMQRDIMRRQYYEYRTRLNNVVPGLQAIPGHYLPPSYQ